MIRVSRTFVRIDVPKASKAKMTSLGHLAFDSAEVASKEFLKLKESGTQVEVRDGSVVIVAQIVLATGAALVSAVGLYDGFFSGLDRMAGQARAVGDFVKQRLLRRAEEEGQSVISTRVTIGDIGRLERISRAVRMREISSREGMRQSLRILGDGGEQLTPTLIRQLEQSLGAPHRGVEWLEDAFETSHERLARRRVYYDGDHTLPHATVRARAPASSKPRRFFMRRDPGEGQVREDFLD